MLVASDGLGLVIFSSARLAEAKVILACPTSLL